MRSPSSGTIWLLSEDGFNDVRERLRWIKSDPAAARQAIQAPSPKAVSNAKTGGQGAQVAILHLWGLLEYSPTMLGAFMGSTDLRKFACELDAAVWATGISSIVIHCDSCGGSAEGVEELGDSILAARARKPVVAVIDPMAASACYWLASQASEITMTPSGMTGSIGCYCLHADESAALADAGITVTIIKKPPGKAAGNPYEPLSDMAREHLTDVVDKTYGKFVSAVADGRGVTPATVLSKYGGGMSVLAEDAKRRGMVDRVEPAGQTIARMASGYRPPARPTSPRASEVLSLQAAQDAAAMGPADAAQLRRRLDHIMRRRP
jgi:capsid assembly protease